MIAIRPALLRGSAALLTVVHLSGCYAYQYVPLDAAPTGANVRGHLSASGMERARELTGRERRSIEGRLVHIDTSGIELALPVRAAPELGRTEPLFERLTFGHGDIAQLELRRLDRVRTGGLLAAAGSVVALLLVRSLRGDTGGGVAPPGGGGTEARIPK